MFGMSTQETLVLDSYQFPDVTPAPSPRPRGGAATESYAYADERHANMNDAAVRADAAECQPRATPTSSVGPSSAQNAYQAALGNRRDRNRLAAEVVAQSNAMCVEHMSNYISQQSLNELVLGMAELGLTSTGAVVVSKAAKLAAAATGVGGLRTLVNDTVYYKQLTPALAKRVVAERNKLLTTIAAKLQVNSLDPDADLPPLQCACGAECPHTVAKTLCEECRKSCNDSAAKPAECMSQCKAACPTDTSAGDDGKSKRPKVATTPKSPPDLAGLVDACKYRCSVKKVFECPNILQMDVAGAQQAAAESNGQVSKISAAMKSLVKKAAADDAADSQVVLIEAAVKAKEAAEAEQKKQTKPPTPCRVWTDYPIDDVLADLSQYHDACSFYHALSLAADDIQKGADAINKDLDAIYSHAAKDAATGDKPASPGGDDTHSSTKDGTSGDQSGGSPPDKGK
jgi:hypothetical protein